MTEPRDALAAALTNSHPCPDPDMHAEDAVIVLAALAAEGWVLVRMARAILAIEAEAPAPLDVERLARALHRSYDRDPSVRRIEWNDLNKADRGMWRRHAAAVIREYAKDPQP